MDELLRSVRETIEQAFGEGGFAGERGSGNVVSEAREVSDFDEVALRGIGQLDIEQGDHEALVIEAEDNILPYLTSEVHGHRLEIGIERHAWQHIRPTKPIKFHLTAKSLHAIQLSGAGSVTAPALQGDRLELTVSGSGDAEIGRCQGRSLEIKVSGSGDAEIDHFQGETLEVDISGSGSCRISGVTVNQEISIGGSGHHRAEDLASETCSIRVAGSGRATVRVEKELDVRVSGAGDIRYIGNPTVHKHISGVGRVRQQSA